MASKKAYILQSGSYNNTTNRFEFHDIEVFSSLEKMVRSVENRMIEVNKGYDIIRNGVPSTNPDDSYSMITYKCLSTDGREMKVRYLLHIKQIQ